MRMGMDRRAAGAIAMALGMALGAATAQGETADGQRVRVMPPVPATAPGAAAQTSERPEVSLRVGLAPPLYRNGAGQIVDPRLGTPIPGQGDAK